MGRKARATKAEIMKPTAAPKSPPQVQTSGATVNPPNMRSEPPLSDNLRCYKKKSKSSIASIRRSQRFKKTVQNQQIERVIQEIDIIESEKEDDPPLNEENKSPQEGSSEIERSSQKDNPGVADIKYKGMYITSQKKIESLQEENRELNEKVKHALQKVAEYEKESHMFSEVMTVIASLSRVNENLSAKLMDGAIAEKVEVEGGVSKKRKRG